jgi:two-component sensor histidine kinase
MCALLLTTVGVKSGVWRMTMQWALKQKGWRGVLIRIALLTTVWLAVAFVFATEIYLSAPGGPVRISWMMAAGSAFRDWFPWILLSPLAITLAEKFRFDRNTWRRSLVVHVVACFVFTLAYQGLLHLAYPAPFGLSTAGMGFISATRLKNPNIAAFSVSGEGGSPLLAPAPPFPEGSNVVFADARHFLAYNAGPISVTVGSNGVIVAGGFTTSSLPAQPPPGLTGEIGLLPPPRWTRFLTLATSRMQFTVPIYLCIVCVCWVINHFQEASEQQHRTLELESRLTEANLQALKMQLQPHFLFNTLNAISSLIREDPTAADDMIGSLSQFLRTTLEVSSKNELPLSRELEFVDLYLQIQQARFGSRLRIQREMDPQSVDALVPPLILQPLVENAIRYGVEPREAGGTVTLRILPIGGMLHLEICDDGEGFKGGQLLGARNGVGLSNTKARLQELYGENHQFKLVANQPAGACVIIEIPIRFDQSGISNDA